jgi:hypothetical protein
MVFVHIVIPLLVVDVLDFLFFLFWTSVPMLACCVDGAIGATVH